MIPGITPLHISDGVLSAPVIGVGWGVSGLILFFTLRRLELSKVPKVSVLTAFFFVASLFHIDIGPSSAHLVLNGFEGITLGFLSFPAIFVGLFLQAILLGHGGLTALGVNALNMGLPALASYGFVKSVGRLKVFESSWGRFLVGFIGGVIGVLLAVLLASLSLILTSAKYKGVASILLLWHLPIMGIEGVIVGASFYFLSRIRPDILEV